MTEALKDPSTLADALLKEVEKVGPDRGLRGSAAGMLLRLVDPGFDPRAYGAESLGQFIARYVPALQVLGYSGTDPVYGMKDWQAGPILRAVTGPKALWRCWVSPMGPAAFVIDKSTGSIAAVPRSHRQRDGEVKLEPAPVDAHRSMARDFLKVEHLEADLLRRLSEAASADDSSWWRTWTQILRSHAPAVLGRWQEYRQKALEGLLEQELRRAGLDEQAATLAFSAIVGTRAGLPQSAGPVARLAAAAPPAHKGDTLALVQAVVAGMSEEQLRALSLPLGLVLDALRNTKRP